MAKANLVITSKGYRYLRFEKWVITHGATTNIFYGIKILRFKFFLCVL